MTNTIPPATRLRFIFFRRLTYSAIMFFIFVVALLFTLPGNLALLKTAQFFVPGLKIELSDNAVFQEGQINLTFENDTSFFLMSDAALKLRFFDCETICIETLSIDELVVKLSENPNKTDEVSQEQLQEKPPAVIDLPFSFRVKQLNVGKLGVEQGKLRFSLKGFEASLSGSQNKIDITRVVTEQARLQLPSEAEKNKPTQPLTLPSITPVNMQIPIALQLHSLKVDSFEIQQGESEHTIDNIHLVANIKSNEISLPQLVLNYNQDVEVAVNGLVSLTEMNAFTLDASISQKQNTVTFNAEGDLNHIDVNSSLRGEMDANLVASIKPTQPMLPFEIQLTLADLEVSTQTSSLFFAQSQANLAGDLSHYQYEMKSRLQYDNLPTFNALAKGTGNLNKLVLDKLTLNSPHSDLIASGDVSLQDKLVASLSVNSTKVTIDEFYPTANGQISFNSQLEFEMENENWQLTIPALQANGDLNGKNIVANVAVNFNEKLHGSVEQFIFKSGENAVTLAGDFRELLDFSGQIKLKDPSHLDKRIQGNGEGQFKIKGQRDKPILDWQLAFKELAFDAYKVSQLSSEGYLDVTQNFLGQASLNAEKLILNDQIVNTFDVDVNGDLSNFDGALNLNADKGEVFTTFKGSFINNLLSTTFEKFDIKNQQMAISPESPVTLTLDSSETLTVNGHCWRGKRSHFCLDDMNITKQEGTIGLTISEFDLSLMQLVLPTEITSNGQIAGHALIDWKNGQLNTIEAKINSQDIQFDINDNVINTQLPIDAFSVALSANANSVNGQINLNSSVLGKALGHFEISDITKTRELDGQFELTEFNLDKFESLSDKVEAISGKVNVSTKLFGTLDTPQISGQANLSDLRFIAPNAPFTVENGHFIAQFNNDEMTFETQLNDQQDGSLSLMGDVSWQQQLNINAKLAGETFKVAMSPSVWATISPNIDIHYEHASANVTGDITVNEGLIKIKNLPEGAQSVSGDELILDDTTVAKNNTPFDYVVDLKVMIEDAVRINSFGLKSQLKGDLQFAKTTQSPMIATGELNLIDGDYRAFGQELLIEQGQLIFAGAVDKPYLNVRAIRDPDLTEDGVIAGIKLTGSVENPALEIFSEPSFDEALALSYVLTGRAGTSSGGSTDGLLMQLLLARGLAKSEGGINKIGRAMGIDDISLASRGSGDDTKVEITGYVSSDIQVRYSIGIFDSMSEIAIRYQLLPKLYIEAVNGINNSLDVLYKFDWE